MEQRLKRTMGTSDLVLLAVGSVIGSGIFLVPGTVLRQTGGNVGLALLVWLVAGILSLLGALTYGELGAMDPEAGGLYIYIRDGFGRLPAFLYGWTLFFVLSSGTVAALSRAFSDYLAQIVPVGPVTAKLISIVMIVVIAAINVRGTRQSVGVQNWTTGFKVGALVLMSALLLSLGTGFASTPGHVWPNALSASVLSAMGVAMIGVLWAYEGWQYVTFSAGETLDPQRTFPRGIALGTAVVIVIYLLANFAYVAALGPIRMAGSTRVAAEAVEALLGSVAGRAVAAAILVSIFSAANAFTLTSSRVFFAMARDGLFFQRLARIHPRFGTPTLSIVASSAWSVALAATGTFDQLLTYVVFVGWVFYGLGALAVFSYRRLRPEAVRPFRTPGYPVTPTLFVLSAAVIVINTLVTQPARALVGLAVVLTGLPAFYIWRTRTSQTKQTASAGQ